MFGSKKNKTVKVRFFEEDSSEPFAETDMPTKQLPDAFELGSAISIGSEEWTILHAEPSMKPRMIECGSMDLRLRKVVMMNPNEIGFTQLDITENFDDHLGLSKEDWINTIPLNERTETPEQQGLPAVDANSDAIYQLALNLSQIRESIAGLDDGVYCPICNHANIDLTKLNTPCPKCERPLLQFGWT